MDSTQIDALLASLPTRKIWAARKGVGSFFTVDVGGRHPGESRELSDLHLWIHLCDWELVKDARVLLASTSAGDEFATPLASLIGEELLGISVGAAPEELLITISGGFQVRLKENLLEYESNDDMLLLYPYEQEAIGYRALDGFYRDSEIRDPK